MKTILAPLDFSSASDAVVNQASALAQLLRARLVLLSVVQPPVIASEFTPLIGNTAEMIATAERYTRQRLDAIRQTVPRDIILVESELAEGLPVTTITAAAERLEATYIVMGSHGHTAFYDLVIGSTTHGVLKRAKCPVVIIPAG